MIAIDLCKQQVLDAEPKTTQQNSFTGDLDFVAIMFFVNEEVKQIISDFYIELWEYCEFILF